MIKCTFQQTASWSTFLQVSFLFFLGVGSPNVPTVPAHPTAEESSCDSFESYVYKMRRPGTWGSQLELMALCQSYGVSLGFFILSWDHFEGGVLDVWMGRLKGIFMELSGVSRILLMILNDFNGFSWGCIANKLRLGLLGFVWEWGWVQHSNRENDDQAARRD